MGGSSRRRPPQHQAASSFQLPRSTTLVLIGLTAICTREPSIDHAWRPISLRTVQRAGTCTPDAQPASDLFETQLLECVVRRIQVRLGPGCGLAVGGRPDWCGTLSVDDMGQSFRWWREGLALARDCIPPSRHSRLPCVFQKRPPPSLLLVSCERLP
jgi:hypothetical protein